MGSMVYLMSNYGSFSYGFILILLLSALMQVIRAMRPTYPGPFISRFTKWVLRWHEIQSTTSFLRCMKLVLTDVDTREKYIDDLHKQYGALVQIAPKQLSVNNVDGVREIFAVTRRLDRPSPLPLFHNYDSENLVSTESGELHQERRRPLRSLYTARAVETEHMQAVFKNLLRRLVALIDEESVKGAPIDILKMSKIFAADLMSHIVYGSENSLNLLENRDMRTRFDKDLTWLSGRLLSIWSLLMFWFPRFGLWLRRVGLTRGPLNTTVPEDLIVDRRAREVLQRVLSADQKTSPDRPESLMERMVSEFRTAGPSLAIPNPNYILSDTLDHFVAGVDTTASALGAACYELSLPINKDKQSKLRQELKDAGIDSNSDITLSKVKAVEYLDFVIRETLRLSPPISFSMERKVIAEEGMEILGHWVPPGMTVGAQPYSIHRNPDTFDNVHEWCPERWDAKEADKFKQMKRHSFAFSAGPRMCIGMNLAMTELKLLLARVYSRYETTLSAEWLTAKGEVRPENDRGELWPRQSLMPVERREPLLFRRQPLET